MTQRQLVWCIAALLVAMLAYVGILLIPRPAHGSAVCLTHSEARKLWPKRHLYWYSSDHCWSNRRGGPPRNLRYDLIRENHAEAVPEKKKPEPSIFYPGVSYAGLPVPRTMMDHAPTTFSFRLLDIDELTSQIPDPPECCWPELNPDGSLK